MKRITPGLTLIIFVTLIFDHLHQDVKNDV